MVLALILCIAPILFIIVGFIVKKTIAFFNIQKAGRKYAWTLLIFSIFCLFTSFSFNTSQINLNFKDGVFGPLTVNQENSVYKTFVRQYLPYYGATDYINVEVLDKNKEYLFSFGKELYTEEGYDDEGKWTEIVDNFESKFVLKNKGEYYFKIQNENKNLMNLASMAVWNVSSSPIPHRNTGWIAFFLSILALMFLYPEQTEAILYALSDA